MSNWRGRCFSRRRTKQGSILIIVLWALFFLAMLGVAINAYILPQLDFPHKLINKAKRYYLAKAGVKRAILELKNDKSQIYDALNDVWSDNSAAFGKVDLGDGQFSVVRDVNSPDEGAYGLADEERKININKAPYDVLRNLLEKAGGVPSSDAQVLAGSIIDWRDADDASTREGAEDNDYWTMTPGYHCKNGDYEALEELLLVKGMTREIFDRIKGSVTIYTQGPVNINTADRVVLECLGMSGELADKIVGFRPGAGASDEDGVSNVFNDPSMIADKLNALAKLSSGEGAQLNKIFSLGLFTVSSDNFMGHAIGQLKGRRDFARIDFIYDRKKKAITYWRE